MFIIKTYKMFRISSLSVMLVNNYYKAWESYIRHLNDLINYRYKKNLKVSYNSYNAIYYTR